MKLGTSRLILSLLMILSPFALDKAIACSCMQNDSPCREAGRSDAVFIGKVVDSKERKTIPAFDEKTGAFLDGTVTYDVGEIYFEVKEAFAGAKKGTRVTIHSGTGGGDCGYWFKRGETYLIYAFGEENKRLYTHTCSRTRPLSKADEDLLILRDLLRANAGATIEGAVGEIAGLGSYDFDREKIPVAGIEMLIQSASGKGKVFKAKTDYQGSFQIRGVPAGKYKINLPLQKDTEFLHPESLVIETTGFGCVTRLPVIQNKNEISGKVVDQAGKPIEDTSVELISANADFRVPSSKIARQLFDLKAGGAFSFFNIPAGSYFLSVRYSFRWDREDLEYPSVFYPNGNAPIQAIPIIIGRGEKIKNIVFQLPPKVEAVKARGTLLWSDGKPIKNTRIWLFDPNYGDSSSSVTTNEKGEFVINGFEGRTYRLMAVEQVKINDEWRDLKTESPAFTLNKNTQPFKLLIEKPKDYKEPEQVEDNTEEPNR